MAITLELPEELEARLSAEAEARGISLREYVQERLGGVVEAPGPRLSLAEIDRLLDEAADIVPEGTPHLTDYAMSRESIYTREDEW